MYLCISSYFWISEFYELVLRRLPPAISIAQYWQKEELCVVCTPHKASQILLVPQSNKCASMAQVYYAYSMGTHLTSLGGLKIIHFVVNIIQILEMLCLTTRYHFQLWQSADANFANLFCPIKKKKLCRFVLKPARGIASGWSSLTASNWSHPSSPTWIIISFLAELIKSLETFSKYQLHYFSILDVQWGKSENIGMVKSVGRLWTRHQAWIYESRRQPF